MLIENGTRGRFTSAGGIVMSKFVVVVFPSEDKAYQGTQALKELHAEGSLTLYGMAVVAKDASGNLKIKDSADDGPLGTAVGSVVGGLVGVIGGPIGALAGVAGGALMGSMVDLFNYGVGADFLQKVSDELGPGKSAIVAEISEDWTTPLDARMAALGGTVLRTWRADFEDEQLVKEAAQSEVELQQLEAEYAQASAETKAKLKAKVDKAKANLSDSMKRLDARLDVTGKEVNAKVAALDKQLADVQDAQRAEIRRRIEAQRADQAARSAKLKQAWALAKEGLG
jgi:uncharacterized membrane protein